MEMYREEKKKITREEYVLIKESLFRSEEKRIKEIHFNRNKEFTIYMENDDMDKIFIKKTCKWGEIITETIENISKENCERIFNNDISWMEKDDRMIVKNLYYQFVYNNITISTVSEYKKEIYGDVEFRCGYTNIGPNEFFASENIKYDVIDKFSIIHKTQMHMFPVLLK